MDELLEFIVNLNPRIQYPPEELDREPVVIIDQSTWEAIVDDAREAMRPVKDRAIAKTEPVTTSRPDWEGFGRALMEGWPTGDVEGSELFDLSLKYNLIAEVPGGYDPEQHIDAEGICPEKGDPWYEYTFRAIAGEDQT